MKDPAQKKQLSLILPAYNEEENLLSTVTAAWKVLSQFSLDFELIIVNDGSRDNTRAVCDRLLAEFPCVRVVHHTANRGYGAALRSGFAAATKSLVFFTDSDGQFSLNDMKPFLEAIEIVDMVVGYRLQRQDPAWRKLNSRVGNFLARTALGIRVQDINCAFKLFYRDRLLSLPLSSDGAFINTELFALAGALGWTFKEMPIRHYPRLQGKPTGGNPLVILKTFQEYFALGTRLRTFAKNDLRHEERNASTHRS